MLIKPGMASGHIITMQRTNPGPLRSSTTVRGPWKPRWKRTFALMVQRAISGVNAEQMRSEALYQEMILTPDSVDAHDVSVASAKAQMTLNITKSMVERAVKAYKDIISIR
jgi:flagellar hook-basal body complex protein FliE